jgi:hypothetical protein
MKCHRLNRAKWLKNWLDSCELCILSSFNLTYADAIEVFEDGDLHTLGMLDYDKRLDHYFTAHPKLDPFTGKSTIFI